MLLKTSYSITLPIQQANIQGLLGCDPLPDLGPFGTGPQKQRVNAHSTICMSSRHMPLHLCKRQACLLIVRANGAACMCVLARHLCITIPSSSPLVHKIKRLGIAVLGYQWCILLGIWVYNCPFKSALVHHWFLLHEAYRAATFFPWIYLWQHLWHLPIWCPLFIIHL